MNKMSINSVILIISLIVVLEITAEEKFCDKKRKLLLATVFNYDKIIFAFSWKSTKENEMSGTIDLLVWRYHLKSNGLIPIGKEVLVNQIFPDILYLKQGFGLTMKCDSSDNTCKSYRQLVFIFFASSYKVFRFVNDRFTTEVNKSTLPWGLKLKGEIKEWFVDTPKMDTMDAIMFMSGYQSKIFIVSNGVLYVSSVDIKAPALKWSKLANLDKSLGGIVIGSDLYINNIEGNTLFKYDRSGKESEKISVWKFFGCEKKFDKSVGLVQNEAVIEEAVADVDESNKTNERDNNLATILIVCVVVVVVLTNIIAGLFWISVYRRQSNNTEN